MGSKKVNWYDRQRVDRDDQIAEREYMQDHINNIFASALGDGISSGLAVTDDSAIVSQATQDAFYDTFIDTAGNRIYQIFKANMTSLLSVVCYGQNVGAAGNVIATIYSLADPTDPTSAINTTPIGQRIIAVASVPAVVGEFTFDFSSVLALSTPGSLTVDHYYAVSIERDSNVGSIDLYYSTANPYTDGHIREFVVATSTFTNRDTWDLYLKVYGGAVQISAGIGYHGGDPLVVATAIRHINLTDNTGGNNYLCIKYKETYTDYETHPRSGLLVPSRIEDDYEIVIRPTLASIASDEEPLGRVSYTGVFPMVVQDLRVFLPGRISIWDAYVNFSVLLTGQDIVGTATLLDCVYYNYTNLRWETASPTNPPEGVYTGSGEISLFGRKRDLTAGSLTPGSDYYMSDTGTLTTTKTNIKIGKSISDTILIIDIDLYDPATILYNQTIAGGVVSTNCVYNNAGTWQKASFTNLPQGIMSATGQIALSGYIKGLAGLVANTWYYMDSTGNLTSTQTKIRVGYAISATVLLLRLEFQLLTQKNGIYQNAIINPDGAIAQRGASGSASFTAANDDTYLIDRWILLSDTNAVVDVSQSTTDIPDGSQYSMKHLVAKVNRKFGILQIIENKNSVPFTDKKVSLSFQAKTTGGAVINNIRCAVLSWSGVADTVTSDIVNSWEASGANPTLVANWTFENTPSNLALTTSWAQYKVENISVDTAGMTNLAVFIWVDDTDCALNDELLISQVQLNEGETAPDFQPRHYAEELALCQRYFQKSFNTNIEPGTVTTVGVLESCPNLSGGAATVVCSISLPVPMRIDPTADITLYNPASGGTGTWRDSSPANRNATVSYSGERSINVQIAAIAVGAVALGHFIAGAEL